MTPPERRPALSLPYRLRGRDGARAAPAPPLLVLLHGRGGNELAMAALADQFDRRYLVVSPRAPIETAPYSYQWFPERFTADGPRAAAPDLGTAVGRLTAFVDEAVAALDADPMRVHVAGFSQGGTLGLATLLASPDRIAAVASMSGWLPPAALDSAERGDALVARPALIVHGRRDETIDPKLGREAAGALAALGMAVEHREREIGHVTTPVTIDEVSAWLSALLDRQEGPA